MREHDILNNVYTIIKNGDYMIDHKYIKDLIENCLESDETRVNRIQKERREKIKEIFG